MKTTRLQFSVPAAVLASALILPAPAHAQHAYPGCPDVKDTDFRKVVVVDRTNANLVDATKFDLAKDGRIFWIERSGQVRRWDPVAKTATNLIKLGGGGLGLVLDPAFETNHWLYAVHNGTGVYRLVRVTVNGDVAGDQKTIFSVNYQAGMSQHTGGSIVFDNAGNLLWGVGDMTSPFNAGAPIDGYGPHRLHRGRK